MNYDDIESLISGVDQSITAATARLSELNLKVSKVDLSVKILFNKEANGEIDFKIIKLGANVSSEKISTIMVSFEPKSVVPASTFEEEFINAIEVVNRSLGKMDEKFNFSSAKIEITFELTVDGRISVVVGGSRKHVIAHTAILTLAPLA